MRTFEWYIIYEYLLTEAKLMIYDENNVYYIISMKQLFFISESFSGFLDVDLIENSLFVNLYSDFLLLFFLVKFVALNINEIVG